ncbi:MAG: hypothetical protein KC583_20555, partial [Myxococcales bacterium]|nr:hypothetical protein [Myxococcales bacterium]
HPCNDTGTCQATLNQWRTAGRLVQDAPGWTCRDPEAAVCAANRQDLTAERVFFSRDMADAPFAPLAEAISQAFRYKVQFRSRDGASVGFAPQVCLPNSDQIPYCYDPDAIEQLRGRVDCLLALWQSPAYDDLDESVDRNNKARLNNTLAEVFSVGPVPRAANLPASELREGFERLYAELLIMLGDEAFTRAFASRYDIAGGRGAAFPGSRFETGGVDLSGVAGGEMRLLYEAQAYYQEALGRFYALAPTIWSAVESGAGRRNFVGPELVTEYLERLVRASTQKTRTASAIARRYQGFDRAALARGVIEREFTAAYLESVVLSRMMLGIVQGVPASARPQIQRFVDASQQRYRAALLDMRNVHRSIRDNVNTFGFAPDYIPFMTVDVRETNAFELAMQRANTRLRLAREREDTAIDSDRRFETDAAEFQAELVRIRNTYETQLRDLCGSFEVDGRVLPAVRKYAELDDTLKYLGDPCGFSGLGEIHKALGQIEIAGLELRRVLQQYENVQAEQDIELAMVESQCNIINARAMFATSQGGRRVTLEEQNREKQFIINRLQAGLSVAQQFAGAANCLPGACARAFAGAGVYAGVAVGVEIGVGFLEDDINDNEIELIEIENENRVYELEQECAAARVTSAARVDTLELQKSTLILDGLRQEYQARLALAEAQRLFHRAKRLQIEQDEAEALAIDVAAARNDPNIRIYRNDAIINAEVAFDLALKDAYRATLIYEYYTSQSYGQRGDLFLIRLVGRGERNLENYLADLQNAFFEFEESFGLPNTRVMVLSLRDDIFKIPRLDGDGRTIPRDERIQQVRDRLADPRLLDENGYLSIPFSTRLDEVSPATRNHKVRYIEAELNVSEPGDSVARLYLTQNGTSVVRAVDDQQLYYRFPPLTAVINPYFSGAKGVFDADVYRNERVRDRPLINTEWRLIINQRDERANQDVNLQSLNDIRLFIYYTDFTRF